MKVKKILILEHIESYAQNDKRKLENYGFKAFILNKDDHLNKENWLKKINDFASQKQIDLIFADTSFHFNIMEILEQIKNVKILYLVYLGEKYKKRQGKSLPKPWLTREDLMSGSKNLVKEIKNILN